MIKALFFDNDGILVDTEKYFFKATQVVLNREGIEFTEEMFIELTLKNNLGGMQLFRDRNYSEDEIENLRRERNHLYSEYLKSEDIFMPGIKDVISELSSKYLLGIVTSSKREHFKVIHERSDLIDFFKFAITIEDYPKSKPNPDPYLKALEISGYRNDECVVIEDSERGLTAAQKAGIKCIVIPNHLTQGSNFSAAWKVLDNIKDLLKVL